jgi:hypothetical protein
VPVPPIVRGVFGIQARHPPRLANRTIFANTADRLAGRLQ